MASHLRLARTRLNLASFKRRLRSRKGTVALHTHSRQRGVGSSTWWRERMAMRSLQYLDLASNARGGLTMGLRPPVLARPTPNMVARRVCEQGTADYHIWRRSGCLRGEQMLRQPLVISPCGGSSRRQTHTPVSDSIAARLAAHLVLRFVAVTLARSLACGYLETKWCLSGTQLFVGTNKNAETTRETTRWSYPSCHSRTAFSCFSPVLRFSHVSKRQRHK